jgi:hypothetical protein
MQITVASSTIHTLLAAIKDHAGVQNFEFIERKYGKFLQSGWVYKFDVEDVLDTLDIRLARHRINIDELCKELEIPWEKISDKPNVKTNSVIQNPALRVEYFAYLLIVLERLGFNTDPSELVNLLLPSIKNKTIINNAEIEVLWFFKQHNKYAPIFLMEKMEALFEDPVLYCKTTNGYKVETLGNINQPIGIKVNCPKYRKRKEPILTECQECGMKWLKGDRDSSYSHRKYHNQCLAYLNPRPNPKFLKELDTDKDAELVICSSPTWKHREIYNRAKAFRREFHYDFVQWHSPKGDNDINVRGYLFADNNGIIIGACAFRKRDHDNNRQYWGLTWVWICPKERGKGHLSKRWPFFRSKFGDFHVEPPVSDSMKNFLKGKNDLSLLKIPE